MPTKIFKVITVVFKTDEEFQAFNDELTKLKFQLSQDNKRATTTDAVLYAFNQLK